MAFKFEDFGGENANFGNYSSFNKIRSASFGIRAAGLCNLSQRLGAILEIC